MAMNSVRTEPSFWGRQFAPQPTAGQIIFDLGFGIVLPVVCLYFDPIVFQGTLPGPLVGSHRVVAIVAIGLAFLSLSAWLLLGRPAALLAGLLAGGAIFAALLGLVLLPFSIIGLFMLIGVLGFAPFITAFVFWRNAVRAFYRARQIGTAGRVLSLAVVGLVISCAGPWALQSYVKQESSRALEMVMADDTAEAAKGFAVLKRFRIFADLDCMVLAYDAEQDAGRRERLVEAYQELTGEEITRRLAVLRD